MRIIAKEFDKKREVTVYGLYWAEYQGIMQRHYYVKAEPDDNGLCCVCESESEVTDNSFDHFILIKSGSNRDMFVHKAAHRDALLDKLTDRDPEALAIFLERLKEYE